MALTSMRSGRISQRAAGRIAMRYLGARRVVRFEGVRTALTSFIWIRAVVVTTFWLELAQAVLSNRIACIQGSIDFE